MKLNSKLLVCLAFACALALSAPAGGQTIKAVPVDKTLTVTGVAAGTTLKSKDEAVAQALRKAVEEACGVFLTAQTKTRDYQTVYDKIFANTVGYVVEHKVIKTWTDEEKTFATVRVRVSTQKFRKNWAVIAHTVEQENNPRIIVAIVEAVRHTATGPTYVTTRSGIVLTTIEDFFLSKGLVLVDRKTAAKVSKRDLLLAAVKDDTKAMAAMAARFKADVVIMGRASAKHGKSIDVSGVTMHQYVATLRVRVVQADAALVLASKTYGPVILTSLQRGGAEDKVLSKLAKGTAPKLLAAVVEAWRKRANVARSVSLSISGMDYKTWKTFQLEAKKLRGVQALRLREITEEVASIDVEYRYTTENLADNLIEFKTVKLEVKEITANRIKLKLAKKPAS